MQFQLMMFIPEVMSSGLLLGIGWIILVLVILLHLLLLWVLGPGSSRLPFAPLSGVSHHGQPINRNLQSPLPLITMPPCGQWSWRFFLTRAVGSAMSHVLLILILNEADFYLCVKLPESVEKFLVLLMLLLDRYNIRNNAWLQSTYSAHSQWFLCIWGMPFLLKCSLLYVVGSDIINLCFDGNVNAPTLPLVLVGSLNLMRRHQTAAMKNK